VSETRGKTKGSVNLDDALRAWPDAEKTHGDWEHRAGSIMSRLHDGTPGANTPHVADANLLVEPLGQSAEDGHNTAATGGTGSASTHPQPHKGTPMTMPADRERDRRSLQDLAKMAHGLTPPPASVMPAPSGVMRATEAKDDDSGIVDLAVASAADPAAALRAQSTPLASQGLFDDGDAPVPLSAAPMSAPAQSSPYAQPVPSMPPVPPSMAPHAMTPSAPPVGLAPVASASASVPVMAAQGKKKGNGAVIALVLGGVVALSAAAAGGILFMKARKAAESAAAAVTTTQPAVIAQAEPPPAATQAAPTPAAEPTPEATPEPANAKTAAKPVVAKGGAKTAPVVAKAEAPAKPEGPAKMTEKDLAAAPAGPAGDLGAAMKKEVGDEPAKAQAAAAAATPTGNVPQKPSQGAVTGALGAVLPGARACLGPDDPISRASVIFSSGGTVQSVSVSGAAAGKPAEACIKGALMKAKVQPFAEATYTAPVTIRHQ
jgi:hypothetical protein